MDPNPNPNPNACPEVYRAIALVQSDLASVGIAKQNKNIQSGYMFRGIDQLYNVLGPSLARHNLVILPRVVSRNAETRLTKGGGEINYVVVHMEFDLVSTKDGSRHTTSMFGEGMDVSDKATNKAESCAYKYMAFQAFCIPVEGEMDDADSQTWETRRQERPSQERPSPPRQERPASREDQAQPQREGARQDQAQPQEIKVRQGENGMVILEGATWKIKDILKANGARWMRDHWQISQEGYDKVIQATTKS